MIVSIALRNNLTIEHGVLIVKTVGPSRLALTLRRPLFHWLLHEFCFLVHRMDNWILGYGTWLKVGVNLMLLLVSVEQLIRIAGVDLLPLITNGVVALELQWICQVGIVIASRFQIGPIIILVGGLAGRRIGIVFTEMSRIAHQLCFELLRVLAHLRSWLSLLHPDIVLQGNGIRGSKSRCLRIRFGGQVRWGRVICEGQHSPLLFVFGPMSLHLIRTQLRLVLWRAGILIGILWALLIIRCRKYGWIEHSLLGQLAAPGLRCLRVLLKHAHMLVATEWCRVPLDLIRILSCHLQLVWMLVWHWRLVPLVVPCEVLPALLRSDSLQQLTDDNRWNCLLALNPFNKLAVQLILGLKLFTILLQNLWWVDLMLWNTFGSVFWLAEGGVSRLITHPLLIWLIFNISILTDGLDNLLFDLGVQRVSSKWLRKPFIYVVVEIIWVDSARVIDWLKVGAFPLWRDVVCLVVLDRQTLQLLLFAIFLLPHLIQSQLQLALPRNSFSLLSLVVVSKIKFIYSSSGRGLGGQAVLRWEDLRSRRQLKANMAQFFADLIHKSNILLESVICRISYYFFETHVGILNLIHNRRRDHVASNPAGELVLQFAWPLGRRRLPVLQDCGSREVVDRTLVSFARRGFPLHVHVIDVMLR